MAIRRLFKVRVFRKARATAAASARFLRYLRGRKINVGVVMALERFSGLKLGRSWLRMKCGSGRGRGRE